MTLRDDLEKALEANRLYEVSGGEPTNLYEFQALAMDLVRDHGPALLEAVRDAERYRWLRHYEMEYHERIVDYNGYLLELGKLDTAIDAAMEGEKG